jgi:hypothetical protein
VKLVLFSMAFWAIVAAVAFAIFLASNFAGNSGTPTYWLPAANVVVVGTALYVAILILIRRRARH